MKLPQDYTPYDLRNCDNLLLFLDLREQGVSVDFVHHDPPWPYDNSGAQGSAEKEYEVLRTDQIISRYQVAFELAKNDTYSLTWCTFPLLEEWMESWHHWWDYLHSEKKETWRYITGGTWSKTNGLGPGFHVRGDSELWLLYMKGDPKPLVNNQSNSLLDRRSGHSEKPQEALQPLLKLCCPVGGLALDPYAGQSASLMRACRATGRRYVGAEINPRRYNTALRRFALEEQGKFQF